MDLFDSQPAPRGRLALAHPDPRHAGLRFDAAAHQYYIHGKPATSVSAVYKRFFPQFDTAYWAARKAAEWGCTAEEVAQGWADKAAASAAAGSALHHRIEAFYNDGTHAAGDADFDRFLDFQRDHAHLVPYRTEWQVYSQEPLLAGTVDFVARNPDGSLSIYDWKRSTKVVDRTGRVQTNAYQTTEGPLRDLPDCAFSQYALQLNLYKWLLETEYNQRVRDLQLVVLHPTYDRYHVVSVPDYPRHVEQMLAAVRAGA